MWRLAKFHTKETICRCNSVQETDQRNFLSIKLIDDYKRNDQFCDHLRIVKISHAGEALNFLMQSYRCYVSKIDASRFFPRRWKSNYRFVRMLTYYFILSIKQFIFLSSPTSFCRMKKLQQICYSSRAKGISNYIQSVN